MIYISETLEPALEKAGINLTTKDYINDPGARREMNNRNDSWKVPPELQSHLATFVGQKITLQGHIPESDLKYLLNKARLEEIDRLLIYQDAMDNPTHYKAWAFRGEPKKYSIDTPISEYLNWFRTNKDNLASAGATSRSSPSVISCRTDILYSRSSVCMRVKVTAVALSRPSSARAR